MIAHAIRVIVLLIIIIVTRLMLPISLKLKKILHSQSGTIHWLNISYFIYTIMILPYAVSYDSVYRYFWFTADNSNLFPFILDVYNFTYLSYIYLLIFIPKFLR